jgi:transposase, IS5 family
MRSKTAKEQYLDFSGESSLKVVNDYRKRYRKISELLEAAPSLVTEVHRDLSRLLSESTAGRSGYASEQILRALVVMFIEGTSFRATVIRIEDSEFLRHFVRLGLKSMMDYSFLNKAAGAISEATWEAINRGLGVYAVREEKIDGEKLRLDTTVVEVNIHYPTDSSLLWDSIRLMSRLLTQIRTDHPEWPLLYRFHTRKVKKLAYFIARNGGSSHPGKTREVKRTYRTLIERVRWIAGVAQEVSTWLTVRREAGRELAGYLSIVKKILDQAERRIFQGEQVPSEEKVYSLFEDHTELLKRGKAGKPIEFGHKVLLAQTAEKFIHHYQVLPHRQEDKELLVPTLEAHRKLFGDWPDVLAADKGFYESREQLAELGKVISVVSIGKKGRRTQEELVRESTEDFKEGQRFRAGSEGSISVLKRAFKLKKSLFKGFKHYAAGIGLAVFCHNLVLLTQG